MATRKNLEVTHLRAGRIAVVAATRQYLKTGIELVAQLRNKEVRFFAVEQEREALEYLRSSIVQTPSAQASNSTEPRSHTR
jgi:hypothetical protein